MKAYHNFKIFYNQSIYPELFNLEKRRQRLLRMMTISAVALPFILFLLYYIGEFEVVLLACLPIGFWISRLVFHVRVFFQEYKPRIVGLILDFLDNDVNFGQLSYDAQKSISKQRFLDSKIFVTPAHEYHGEDYIRGKIREMPFEMCELRVGEISPVRTKVTTVFQGIFCIGNFLRPEMNGAIILLPDTYRKYLTMSARAVNLLDAKRIKSGDLAKQEVANLQENNKALAKKLTPLLLPEFEASFDTYATPDIPLRRILSQDMQRALLNFRQKTGREIYVSIIKSEIFIAIYEPTDILEPTLFSSVLNFSSVNEYYEDLKLLLSVIHEVDVLY